jgi:hypothetical protein
MLGKGHTCAMRIGTAVCAPKTSGSGIYLYQGQPLQLPLSLASFSLKFLS